MDRRSTHLLVFAAALVVFAFSYFGTLSSIVGTWWNNVAYSHGFLILPISLWLIWRQREPLSRVTFDTSWLGVAGLVLLTLLWMTARGVGVLVVEQFAVIAMIPVLVLAVLGAGVVRALLFPLFFLLFMVPFGQGLLPWMMQITADVSTWALHLTGLPVYRSHMYLTIPYGDFEIAKACGGLKYVITGLVLGALYTHLTYRKPWKRAVSMLVFLVVPILANALRVYVIVVVSYMTKFKFGPGAEHVEFGRVLFIVVMVAIFWIGRRWADAELPVGGLASPATTASTMTGSLGWLPAITSLAVLVLGPIYVSHSASVSRERFVAAVTVPGLPVAASGWTGPIEGADVWRPHFSRAVHEAAAAYANSSGQVEVFVAVYGLGSTLGGEMISYENVLSTTEHESLMEDSARQLRIAGSKPFDAREVVIRDERGTYLVWQWFMVGDRKATNPFVVKFLEAIALMSRGAYAERVVTLATPYDGGARDRLQQFVDSHAQCVAAGFMQSACAR